MQARSRQFGHTKSAISRWFRAASVVVLLVSAITRPGRAQSSALAGTGQPSLPVSDINSVQNPFQGSVSSGPAAPQTLQLSLQDALEKGLHYNLAVLLNEESSRASRGQRWQALSHLLPHLTTTTMTGKRLVNLYAIGFPTTIRSINPISGPFNVFDARAYVSGPLLNFQALRNEKAASDEVEAAGYTYQDARNVVVLVTSNAYLLAVASQAEVQSAEAQVATAKALYEQAVDRYNSGFSPEIDTLRAHVELQSREQHLIAARNDERTAKLNLARVIGLPDGQQFDLSTPESFQPLPETEYAKALSEALANRADYKAAEAEVRAAEARRRAIVAERYPSLGFAGDFGDAGFSPPFSHDTFTIAATLNIPVFQGGKVRGELIQADAQLKKAQDQLNNLKGQISYDVRTALMNIETAAEQVAVAKSNVALARETLAQAKDRYASGVTDNIEVIQAQDALAGADDAYIASLYQHNVAKVALARALGNAEHTVLQYVGGK